MTLQALTIKPDGSASLQSVSLGATLSTKGATAEVHAIENGARAGVVGKIFKAPYRKHLAQSPALLERLLVLAGQSVKLRAQLPFCSWPDALLFTGPATTAAEFAANLAGFTMDRFTATTSLLELISVRRSRIRLTPQDGLVIAITLAQHIDKLHKHPNQFVFGDLSPNNILVSGDCTRVMFIDTDAFQFSASVKGRSYVFPNDGVTPSYTSPYALNRAQASLLPKEHDLFVLAILIFQILIADKGFLKCHPFSSGAVSEDDRIRARQFPYAEPSRYPVPPAALKAYQSLPAEIRSAFQDVFTAGRVVTPDVWVRILSSQRRSLHGSRRA